MVCQVANLTRPLDHLVELFYTRNTVSQGLTSLFVYVQSPEKLVVVCDASEDVSDASTRWNALSN